MSTSRRRLDLETSLLRIVVGYRVIGAAWLVILAGVTLFGSSDVARPRVVVAAVVLAVGWTTGVVVVSFRRAAVLRSLAFVAADVVVALLTLLAPIVAETEGFTGGYPLAAVFHGVYAAGWLGGMASAGALTAISTWRVVRQEITDLTSASANIVSFVFTAAATAWAIDTIRSRDAMRIEAQEALAAEREERLRAEERADLAAKIHDGVLQTLALIQRDRDDPARVSSLARRQERELREVLFGSDTSVDGGFRTAMEKVRSEVEEMTGIAVSLVLVGDRAADNAVSAAVLAAREAMINAAKHSGVAEVSVYGEANDEAVAIYVRDRGAGFDVAAVPDDRRGLVESIVGRVEAAGGSVGITSGAAGTEVRIVIGAG